MVQGAGMADVSCVDSQLNTIAKSLKPVYVVWTVRKSILIWLRSSIDTNSKQLISGKPFTHVLKSC
jgi:hypothetical protein